MSHLFKAVVQQALNKPGTIAEAIIPEFQRVIKTLQNWKTELLLNTFSFVYNNGFVEGLNNLTKVIKRNAFGFRRFDQLFIYPRKRMENFVSTPTILTKSLLLS